ncbi:MAG: DegV family protein, partial [Brevinema sp.]
KALGLCPVLQMNDGQVFVSNKAFGFEKAFDKTVTAIKESMLKSPIKHYIIAHSILNEEVLSKFVDKLSKTVGFAPTDINVVPPSIISHVGLDAISVGVVYQY